MPAEDDDDQLLTIADELYAAEPGDFTVARDALVKALRGRPDLAKRVKALRKPSTAAWVVNAMVRHEADQVSQVLAVGVALREAQASMSGAELRALTRQRRQLTAALTTRARALAVARGHRVSDAVGDQVEATLTAAMVDVGCAAALRSGLLVTALSATGVADGDPASAVALPQALGFQAAPVEAPEPAASQRPELRVVPDPDAEAKALAAARAELAGTEVEVARAQESFDEAAGEMAKLEARSMQVQAEADELRGRLAALESTSEEVDDELGDAEDSRSAAEAALAQVTAQRDDARRAVEALPGG